MCFSASASFAAAAFTGAAGTTAAVRCGTLKEAPLAVIPFIFALQQAIEGVLWLNMVPGADRAFVPALATIFLTVALGIWPLWAPLAIGLVEPVAGRRVLMQGLLAAGAAVAAYGAWLVYQHPYTVAVTPAGLCYVNDKAYSNFVLAAYAVCAGLPAILSSHRALRLFGVAVTAGMIVAMVSHYVSFVSVWCFFAALSSMAIVGYFLYPARAASKEHHALPAQ